MIFKSIKIENVCGFSGTVELHPKMTIITGENSNAVLDSLSISISLIISALKNRRAVKKLTEGVKPSEIMLKTSEFDFQIFSGKTKSKLSTLKNYAELFLLESFDSEFRMPVLAIYNKQLNFNKDTVHTFLCHDPKHALFGTNSCSVYEDLNQIPMTFLSWYQNAEAYLNEIHRDLNLAQQNGFSYKKSIFQEIEILKIEFVKKTIQQFFPRLLDFLMTIEEDNEFVDVYRRDLFLCFDDRYTKLSELNDLDFTLFNLIGDIASRITLASNAMTDFKNSVGVIVIDLDILGLNHKDFSTVDFLTNLQKAFPKIQFIIKINSQNMTHFTENLLECSVFFTTSQGI